MNIHLSPLAELRALFRSRPAFRQVFLADVVAQLGDGGLLIAFPMLVLDRTHDVTLTGLAFSGEILALGLMSPVAGYWADRLEQKRLMITANLARVALLGVILVALLAHLPAVLFLVLSVALGAAGAFFMPARSAFLRRIVAGEELERVIALEGTASFLLRLVSPPLMGLLLAVFPVSVGIALTMLAYLFSMAILSPSWVTGTALLLPEGGTDDWREGWRFILAHTDLRGLLLLDVLVSVVGMAAFSITVAFLDQVLHLPPQANGWLLATTGLTGAVGTQLAARMGQRRWTYAVITGAIAVTYLSVPFATTLPALMAMWMLRGLAIGAFCVLLNQRIAAVVPAHVMGRVNAAWGLAACGAGALGSAATPVLLRTLGAAGSYALFGGLLAALSLCLAFGTLRARGPIPMRDPEWLEAN
jgi:MFS family permease